MIIIREAKHQDKDQLRLLIKKWIETQKAIKAPDDIDLNVLEQTGWSDESPLCYCTVAEDEGEKMLIGYALCTYNYAIWTGKGLLLENIFVEENYRRKAVGSRLLSAVVKHGFEKQCQQINYYTQKDDPSARKFFEKFNGSNITESEGWLVYSMSRQAIESNGRWSSPKIIHI